MESKWQRMNRECAEALQSFAQEASKTCGILASIKEQPAPFPDRKKLLKQRAKENSAYNAYLHLRLELCRKAAPGG
jgi:hypothetical protein